MLPHFLHGSRAGLCVEVGYSVPDMVSVGDQFNLVPAEPTNFF